MSSEASADYSIWGRIILAGGQTQTWWATWWMFDEARYVDFDASPDAVASPGVSSVQVVEKWAERNSNQGTVYKVTFRNRGAIPVSFRVRQVVIPARRWWGGGTS